VEDSASNHIPRSCKVGGEESIIRVHNPLIEKGKKRRDCRIVGRVLRRDNTGSLSGNQGTGDRRKTGS